MDFIVASLSLFINVYTYASVLNILNYYLFMAPFNLFQH